MGLVKLKPNTPGQRFKVAASFDSITKSTPEKSLIRKIKKSGGRNNTGKMTMRYIGGGHKQKNRTVDFKRDKDGIPGVVKSIEYDPGRTARIALITQRLDLSTEQAQKFWPIYNEYSKKRVEIRADFNQAMKNHNPKTASEEENRGLLEK